MAGADPAQSGAGVQVSAEAAEPFYSSPEIGILILLLWLLVPLALGYSRFSGSDL